ncbi:response regulator [Algoriphagus terrigena]|uniref:response regulator n=1 Tax=Algoriphagus terrigena TaxID=344884 RepID=UPI0004093E11|nr:PAS domain S-box protein [Algoriphagus terrigena]
MRKDEKPYSILIIEDNLGDYFLIEEYLAENILAPQLQRTETFQAAKKTIADSPAKFDIIFLDLSLPDLSGEQLIVEVLELAGGTPVVALTGFSDLEFSMKSMALGVSDYLLKDELTPTILYKTIIYSIQRKKFTEQIQRSEKRYSDLFQLSPLPMWVFELDTLRFLSVNRAAVNHYGYSEKEFLSMDLTDIRPSEEIGELKKSIEDAKKAHLSNLKKIFRHRKKSGELITVETTVNRLNFNGKEAVLVLVNDVTERNKYIETVEKQNQTFLEIAWIQSHVVRAPLARLLGLVNLLESEMPDKEPEINSLMGFIKDSAFELDEIIRDISKKSEIIEHLDDNDN